MQQFHLGPLRNNNSRLLHLLGADAGVDSIGDFNQATTLSRFLNALDKENKLAKTILYNINPADNEVFATMCGNFNDGITKGKIQYGSGWWFLDQKDGIEKQLNALSNMGVVSTHTNLELQITTLVAAWEWSHTDHTFCVLPLHHVHGIVNVISCALWSGATCQFIPEFSAQEIVGLFEKGEINVFMAVPTIYFKLIAYWESLPEEKQVMVADSMKNFRLMVCGSAALPVSVMEKWKIISGHTLLERYRMTEISMAISNPYHGERRAGYVGLPLPGVEVKLVDEELLTVKPGEPGEILVRGENVFTEYWNKPEATAKEFTSDGWFKTGQCVDKNILRC